MQRHMTFTEEARSFGALLYNRTKNIIFNTSRFLYEAWVSVKARSDALGKKELEFTQKVEQHENMYATKMVELDQREAEIERRESVVDEEVEEKVNGLVEERYAEYYHSLENEIIEKQTILENLNNKIQEETAKLKKTRQTKGLTERELSGIRKKIENSTELINQALESKNIYVDNRKQNVHHHEHQHTHKKKIIHNTTNIESYDYGDYRTINHKEENVVLIASAPTSSKRRRIKNK